MYIVWVADQTRGRNVQRGCYGYYPSFRDLVRLLKEKGWTRMTDDKHYRLERRVGRKKRRRTQVLHASIVKIRAPRKGHQIPAKRA